MATWLAADQLDFHGAAAVASGWLQRARRLLEPLDDFYRETFGPAVAAYGGGRADELDRDFLAFATRRNRGEPDGPSEYHYGYLLVVAKKR